MNLVNEIGNDVARAFLIGRQNGRRLDASRMREIIAAIQDVLGRTRKENARQHNFEPETSRAATATQ